MEKISIRVVDRKSKKREIEWIGEVPVRFVKPKYVSLMMENGMCVLEVVL